MCVCVGGGTRACVYVDMCVCIPFDTVMASPPIPAASAPAAAADAEACVVAFSTIDRDSFEAVESWIKKVEDEVGRIPMVLIQNKVGGFCIARKGEGRAWQWSRQ